MKLHLGCGRIYLKGYVNIDYPPEEQSIQSDIKADIYKDIAKLKYKKSSVDEIRLHHVFEHFSRYSALAQLCKWRDWLKVGGLLIIETPDALASFKMVISPFLNYTNKQQVLRHLFGSHEASWAVHYDGWYKEKFKHTLKELGFNKFSFKYTNRGVVKNIIVAAYKTNEKYSFQKYKDRVKKLLSMSTIKVNTKDKCIPEDSELDMLNLWLDKWTSLYKNKK